MKVMITGVTGMVGEGVLLECLANPKISEVLIVARRNDELSHPKLKSLILKDFKQIGEYGEQIKSYDACFFCAGVSSVGENEASFTQKTYDFVVPFAQILCECNPNMTFVYVSGSRSDSTETGKVMWARVKGRTENALMKLPFKGQYNFRPAIMKAVKGQKNVRLIYKIIAPILSPFYPVPTLSLHEVGKAMIYVSEKGFNKQILEADDIRAAA